MTNADGANLPFNNLMAQQTAQALPMVPWVGGKRRLAQRILPLFPDHSCYVEPFCGAAALFFLKEPSKVEVLNDINSDLVQLYRVVQHHLDEFVRHFRWALASRELYRWLQATPPATLTDIQRAARFFYLMKCGFGGKVEGQSFGTATTARPRLNLLPQRRPPEAAPGHHRAPTLGGLLHPLRPPAHAVLPRSAILGD